MGGAAIGAEDTVMRYPAMYLCNNDLSSELK